MFEVFTKELQSSLRSMIGWVYIAFVLFITGIYTVVYNFFQGLVNYEFALGSMRFVFLILVPLMTMNTLAGERRAKTDQFLLTSPLSVTEIIMGKYLALLGLLAVPMIIICIYPLILAQFGGVSLGTVYGTALAVFGLGMVLLAIGMFISSLTDNPVISAVLTLAVMLVLYWLKDLAGFLPTSSAFSMAVLTFLILLLSAVVWKMTGSSIAALILGIILEAGLISVFMIDSTLLEGVVTKGLTAAAPFSKIDNFAYGLFDITALIYDLSVSALFLFFTVQSVEARRWR